MSADDLKRAVGETAADLVQSDMIVGLGTGSTAAFLVRALAERRLDIRCVATSTVTASLASELGLLLVDIDAVREIDLTIDGADEIGPDLTLIKGGGAALLREKLVWEASRRCVCIADASKVVKTWAPFRCRSRSSLSVTPPRCAASRLVWPIAASLSRHGCAKRTGRWWSPTAATLSMTPTAV
jgi:ribose 5-phosphate isomerase